MATGSSRDIELVIRARDEAGKALTSIADALNILRGAQDAVGASAQKNDGLIGALGSALTDLQRQATGLTALGVVAKQIDRASDAVERLDKASQTAGSGAAALAAKHAQLAEAGERLNASLTETKAHLDAERAAVTAAEAAQGRLAAQIERVKVAYSASHAAITATKAPSDEMQAGVRGQRDALIALNEQHSAGEERLTAQKSAVKDLASQYGALNRQVTVNSSAQARVAADVTNANEAYQRSLATLEKARAELATMSGAGAAASSALGGVAVSQEAVADASKATAKSIDEVTAAMKRQATAPDTAQVGPAAGNTAAYRAQIQAVKDTRAAWEQARASATNLGQEMARTASPSREMSAQFVVAKAAAAEAKQAFFDQAAALNTLRGVTQGSAGAFARTADAMTAEGNAARRAALGLREIPDIAPQVRPLTASLRELLEMLFRVPSAAGGADGAMRKMGDGSRESLSIFQRLRGEIAGLITGYVGLYAAVSALGQVIKTISTVQNAHARLSVVFDGDAKRAGDDIQWLMGQAERLGIPFDVLASEYTKVAIASKEMGISNEAARGIFVSLAEAGRVAGLDASETAGMFRGLAESIDRGTLNARNFNMQIGMRVPGSMHAMADAVGVSIQKFTELQRSGGGVAATEDTLVKFAQNLSREYSGALPEALGTVTAQLGRLQTFMQESEIKVGEGGFTDSLKALIDDLDGTLNSSAGAKSFEELGHSLGVVVSGLRLVADNFGLVSTAAEFFIALKVAGWVRTLASANGGMAASFKLAQADVAAFGGSLATLNMEKMAGWWASFRLQVIGAGTALAALGADGAVAAAGTAAADVALGVMNGIMVTVAATARTMWAAVGGFPGLLIMGATFILSDLLGQWMSGVDNANSAMETHDELIQRVIDNYHKAADAADQFALEALKSNAIDLMADKIVQRQTLSDAQGKGIRDVSGMGMLASNGTTAAMAASGSFGGNAQSQAELSRVITLFQQGRLSALDFKKSLSELAAADGSLDMTVIHKLSQVADSAADAAKKIEIDSAGLATLSNTATDAERALFGVANAATQVSQAFDPTKLDQYNDALSKFNKLTPQGKHDQQYQDALASAQVDLKNALTDPHLALGVGDPQFADIIKDGLKPIAGISAAQMALAQKAYDAYLQTMKQIAADEQHRQNASISQGIGKSLDGFLAAYFRAEGVSNGHQGSSAAGYGGFLRSTWLGSKGHPGLFDQRFPDQVGLPDDQKLQLRMQPEIAKKVATTMFEQIIGELAKAKIDPTFTNLYLSAFLGPAGGPRMIRADRSNPNSPATQFAGADQASANPTIFFKNGDRSRPRTVDELVQLMASKIGQGNLPAGVPERDYQSDGLTAQQILDAKITELVKALNDAAHAVEQSPRDAFIQSKITEAERDQKPGDTFSPEQRASVTSAAGASFDASEQQREKQTVADLTVELNKKLKAEADLTRQDYIQQEATKDKIDLLTVEGKIYADLQGKLYDLNKQESAYNSVTGLSEQRKQLLSSLKGAFKEGDADQVRELQGQIDDITKQIQVALPGAIAFAQALGDQKMLATLQKVETSLKNTKTTLTDAKEINQLLAQGITDGFKKATDALGQFIQGSISLKSLFKDIGGAFLNFAADFLQKIAMMILQQEVLNLLQKSPIGSKIADLINGATGSSGTAALSTAGTTLTTAGTTLTTAATQLIAAATQLSASATASSMGGAGGGSGSIGNIIGALIGGGGDAAAAGATLGTSIGDALVLHGGGVVGRPGGMVRSAWSDNIAATARRMHSGGVAGLLPGEVATILKRNEEVLTEDDPRHIFKQGKGDGGGGGGAPVVNLKNINAFSAHEMMSQAMDTTPGEKVIINFVRKNQRAVRAALGV